MLQNLESRKIRELEVHEDQRRQRILATVAIFIVAVQVVDGLLAIGRQLEIEVRPCFLKGSFEKKSIVLVVLDEENGGGGVH